MSDDLKLDTLPELPDDFRAALEADQTLPELPLIREGMGEREFDEYVELRRKVDAGAGILKAALKRAQQILATNAAWERWHRPRALEFVRRVIFQGSQKGRGFAAPDLRYSGALRKERDQIELNADKSSDFLLFDAEHAHAFTRFTMRASGLSHAEMEQLRAALPARLQTAVKVDWEPRLLELARHRKETGEVPPGCRLRVGEDDLKLDAPEPAKLPAGNPHAPEQEVLRLIALKDGVAVAEPEELTEEEANP